MNGLRRWHGMRCSQVGQFKVSRPILTIVWDVCMELRKKSWMTI